VIETIEGFQSDPIMISLRKAFAENHALQCGFCTPGMIVTARDIVLRLSEPDETRIRHELSGNLCRCTGYVGIVKAVASVIRERGAAATIAPQAVARPALRPFALVERTEASAAKGGGVTVEGGATTIARRARLAAAPDAAAALFADVPRVAGCVPGAAVTSIDGDVFQGAITIKFGPIGASFAGEGRRQLAADAMSGLIKAEGRDANGQSNARGELGYRLSPEGEGTAVDLTMSFRLQGLLAQFNRADLVESFADLMLNRFVANCEATLAGRAAPAARELGAFGLLWALLKARFAKWARG
jgi:carbon-monoxide dehydrogenase small subunit